MDGGWESRREGTGVTNASDEWTADGRTDASTDGRTVVSRADVCERWMVGRANGGSAKQAGWTDGRDGWVKRTIGQADGRSDSRTIGRADVRTDLLDGLLVERIDQPSGRAVGRQAVGWSADRADGRAKGYKDGEQTCVAARRTDER